MPQDGWLQTAAAERVRGKAAHVNLRLAIQARARMPPSYEPVTLTVTAPTRATTGLTCGGFDAAGGPLGPADVGGGDASTSMCSDMQIALLWEQRGECVPATRCGVRRARSVAPIEQNN